MNPVNAFKKYEGEENRFTNGLISLLSLSGPKFVREFLRELLHNVRPKRAIRGFRVQVDHGHGVADAELSGDGCRLWFETKVVSGRFDDHARPRNRRCQICRHIRGLERRSGRLKRLILLTPDDSGSSYIKHILSNHKPWVLHLEWRRVYDYLDRSSQKNTDEVLSKLIRQFLEQIRDCIFEQDYAGIIQKVSFGKKADIYSDTYLSKIKKWRDWNTPHEYKKLNGTGRKLMLYDKYRGITAEVEIRKVKRTNQSRDFPWTNFFAPGTLRVYRKSKRIPLEHILTVLGFEKPGMTSHWNVTQEQYRQLKEAQGK